MAFVVGSHGRLVRREDGVWKVARCATGRVGLGLHGRCARRWHRVRMEGGGGMAQDGDEAAEAVDVDVSGAEWKKKMKQKQDLNVLQTQLRFALKAEDYQLAAEIRDKIQALLPEGADVREFVDWRSFGVPAWLADRLERLGWELPLQIQRQAMIATLEKERDAAVLSQTGSGKSLAYMVPLLSRLSDQLFECSSSGKLADKRAPVLALVVVPSKELAAKQALLLYQLLGGDLRKESDPGSKLNMYQYTGPRGIRVVGVFDEDTATRATEGDLLEGIQIVLGTPKYLARVVKSLVILPQQLEAVVVDEFDRCLEMGGADTLNTLISSRAFHMVCGASVTPEQIQRAVLSKWLNAPLVVTEKKVFENIEDAAGIKRLPGGLTHRYCIVDGWRALSALKGIIKSDVNLMQATSKSPSEASPRVVVFVPNEEIARGVAEKLRLVMWGQSTAKIAVLLPKTGVIPFQIMEYFRDGVVNMLIMTPESSRGLDFPNVSHVYNLYLPLSIEDYLHQAGRAGRVGQTAPGIVTSLVAQEDRDAILKIAEQLEIGDAMQQIYPPETELPDATDKDSTIRFLEDLYYLEEAEGPEPKE
ncbi:RNA helicase CrhR [Porphyridium purpureum]|uniref:RNA helicase CrhR n=1 Tax=Porphyridium purpureum TaxID=35688 RepID=A0A5J4Z4Z1_PORPP|nr:RNA helicase CrhR [Porphyridium purpureum]|eukprot:POR3186..scf295_1